MTGGKPTKKSSIIFLSREILKYLVQFVFVIVLDHTQLPIHWWSLKWIPCHLNHKINRWGNLFKKPQHTNRQTKPQSHYLLQPRNQTHGSKISLVITVMSKVCCWTSVGLCWKADKFGMLSELPGDFASVLLHKYHKGYSGKMV